MARRGLYADGREVGTLDETRLQELIAEADAEFADHPDRFEPPAVMQPPAMYREEAEGLLGDDAPWHRVVVVAHALQEEAEAE
jgi:hypothetical protein